MLKILMAYARFVLHGVGGAPGRNLMFVAATLLQEGNYETLQKIIDYARDTAHVK